MMLFYSGGGEVGVRAWLGFPCLLTARHLPQNIYSLLNYGSLELCFEGQHISGLESLDAGSVSVHNSEKGPLHYPQQLSSFPVAPATGHSSEISARCFRSYRKACLSGEDVTYYWRP